MKICDDDKCTGCGACTNLCPKKCITMKEDLYGEIHPKIDENKCVQCRKCINSCPANLKIQFSKANKVYASWRQNVSLMKNSASGGVGAVLAENWIKKGGIVYGTKYDKNFSPRIVAEKTLSGIEGFKGSKYIQSNTDKVFFEIKQLLKNKKKILFFGTPCQIAGLYAICNKYDSNLVTVEILCHGVAPEKYFHEELDYIEKKYNIKHYDNVTFRTNRWMMDFYFGLWNKDKLLFSEQAYENHYFRGFLTGLTLRESCYNCKYKSEERIGDIMIGDFIGFGIHIPYEKEHERPSLIICTSEKGLKYVHECQKDLVLVERTLGEAKIEGRSLREPFPRHKKQKEFRNFYKQQGFINAINATVKDEIELCKKKNKKMHMKRKVKFFLSDFCHIKIQNGRIYHED